MKLLSVIKKSLKEQIRHFWILLLTITMAPFFVGVYYLINETAKPHYTALIVNRDRGVLVRAEKKEYGLLLLAGVKKFIANSPGIPLTLEFVDDKATALEKLKNKKADAVIVIPEGFSQQVRNWLEGREDKNIEIEFIGDLTSINYMVSAIWANGIIDEYVFAAVQKTRPLKIIETGLGASGKIEDFDYYVPGLLILSIIMLMFSASIAVVAEVENKTMIRLKLSTVNALEFLSGVGIIQVAIGIISVLLTLAVAMMLGFHFAGSFILLIVLAVLTSISIIAFSLIVAAITKSANEILIVGNFPLLLFMFFTGAAFPIKAKTLFTLFGYPVTWQSFMSPTHAIDALKKVAIMNMGLRDILPEIIAMIIVTVIYFAVGVWAFQRRHMKVE